MKHIVRWHTASPVWELALADGAATPRRFDQPLILRFAGDDFMDQLQGTLAGQPTRLSEYAVRPETWRTPALDGAGWRPIAEYAAATPPKLYQAAHDRFYVVAAQLICQQRGLPDRGIDAADGERAAFLVRRLFARPGQTLDPGQPSTYDEYGWFGDRQQGSWLKIEQPDVEAPTGEERVPMFPSAFKQQGRNRRLFAGMVPVASREVYESGRQQEPIAVTASEPASDPRFARFSGEVAAALAQLVDLGPDDEAAQDSLIFSLIAFGDYLRDELPAVWDAIADGGAAPGDGAALVDLLEDDDHAIQGHDWTELLANANASPQREEFLAGERPDGLIPIDEEFTNGNIVAGAASLQGSDLGGAVEAALGDARVDELGTLLEGRFEPLAALPAAWGDAPSREALLAALLELAAFFQRELSAVWSAVAAGSPSGLTPEQRAVYELLQSRSAGAATWRELLADADARRASIEAGQYDRSILAVRLEVTKAQVEALAAEITAGPFLAAVEAALVAEPITPDPPPEEPTAEAFYVIRCVYDRPRCDFAPPVLSRASRPFRLASFFDPDAPVRPVRVTMPVDTSFEGLSKFPKGVQFRLSDQLRRQMERAEQAGMQGLLDGNGGSAPLNLGMICSFSIPIITICALILLMIIVQLLNIVFWWVPLFRICLPLPLKAK